MSKTKSNPKDEQKKEAATTAKPHIELVNPNGALMPDSPQPKAPTDDAPATADKVETASVEVRSAKPGSIRSITIQADEFEDQRGSLTFKVTLCATGEKPITQSITMSNHHFHGYFDSVWKDMGRKFKDAVG